MAHVGVRCDVCRGICTFWIDTVIIEATAQIAYDVTPDEVGCTCNFGDGTSSDATDHRDAIYGAAIDKYMAGFEGEGV